MASSAVFHSGSVPSRAKANNILATVLMTPTSGALHVPPGTIDMSALQRASTRREQKAPSKHVVNRSPASDVLTEHRPPGMIGRLFYSDYIAVAPPLAARSAR